MSQGISIFSPMYQQQSVLEEAAAANLPEEYKRGLGKEEYQKAQQDRNELPMNSRFIKDSTDGDIINGFEKTPNIRIPSYRTHDSVHLLQQARASFRAELNKYNTPLQRDDFGNIIGNNRAKQFTRREVEHLISKATGKDAPDFKDEP